MYYQSVQVPKLRIVFMLRRLSNKIKFKNIILPGLIQTARIPYHSCQQLLVVKSRFTTNNHAYYFTLHAFAAFLMNGWYLLQATTQTWLSTKCAWENSINRVKLRARLGSLDVVFLWWLGGKSKQTKTCYDFIDFQKISIKVVRVSDIKWHMQTA